MEALSTGVDTDVAVMRGLTTEYSPGVESDEIKTRFKSFSESFAKMRNLIHPGGVPYLNATEKKKRSDLKPKDEERSDLMNNIFKLSNSIKNKDKSDKDQLSNTHSQHSLADHQVVKEESNKVLASSTSKGGNKDKIDALLFDSNFTLKKLGTYQTGIEQSQILRKQSSMVQEKCNIGSRKLIVSKNMSSHALKSPINSKQTKKASNASLGRRSIVEVEEMNLKGRIQRDQDNECGVLEESKKYIDDTHKALEDIVNLESEIIKWRSLKSEEHNKVIELENLNRKNEVLEQLIQECKANINIQKEEIIRWRSRFDDNVKLEELTFFLQNQKKVLLGRINALKLQYDGVSRELILLKNSISEEHDLTGYEIKRRKSVIINFWSDLSVQSLSFQGKINGSFETHMNLQSLLDVINYIILKRHEIFLANGLSQPFNSYVTLIEQYFLNKYGCRSMAYKACDIFSQSIQKYSLNSPRIQVFSEILGISNSQSYSNRLSSFVTYAINCLIQCNEPFTNLKDVKDFFRNKIQQVKKIQIRKMINKIFTTQTKIHSINTITLHDDYRTSLINELSLNDENEKVFEFDLILSTAIKYFKLQNSRNYETILNTFHAFDYNNRRTVTVNELIVIFIQLSPQVTDDISLLILNEYFDDDTDLFNEEVDMKLLTELFIEHGFEPNYKTKLYEDDPIRWKTPYYSLSTII